MRACEEEFDVYSYLPCSLSAESEFLGIKGGSILQVTKNLMINCGEDVARRVLGENNSSTGHAIMGHGAGQIRHLHCVVLSSQEQMHSDEIRPKTSKWQTLA